MLAVPDSCVGGEVTAITPDGHYAVGRGLYADTYMEAVVMWDLQQDGLLLDLSGIPFEDMVGENNNQRRLIDVTPDGNKVLGCISYSYVSPPASSFLYMTAKPRSASLSVSIPQQKQQKKMVVGIRSKISKKPSRNNRKL